MRIGRGVGTGLAVVTAVLALAVGAAPAAVADVDSASPSPSTWAPGSSPAFTLVMQTSGTLDGAIGFWNQGSSSEWHLTSPGTTDATLVGSTFTCGSGVTFSSSAFSTISPGTFPDVCFAQSGGSYVDMWLQISDIQSITGNYTVTMTLPSGFLVGPTTLGDYVLQAYGYDGTDNRTEFTITVAEGTGGEDNTPTPIEQQVALPASGSCDAIDDATLDWGTGLRGGWTPSWSQWVNDGAGGPVCTRTVLYSNARAAWVLG